MTIPGVEGDALLPTEEMVLDEDLLNAINDPSVVDFVDTNDGALDATMGDLVVDDLVVDDLVEDLAGDLAGDLVEDLVE